MCFGKSELRDGEGRCSLNLSPTQYHGSPSGAIFSTCEKYRYVLWRRWGDAPPLAFIGLNPSTADASQDDPTIRRCIGFAKRFQAGGLVMLNLFAFRATDPSALVLFANPDHPEAGVGPNHDEMIRPWMGLCNKAIAAWGASVPHRSARPTVLSAMAVDTIGGLWCLGQTKDGSPRHPLYLKKDATPSVWCGSPKWGTA
jgi:hypothetical protein